MAKVSIKQASKGLNTFDLSGHHITTTDFGQTQISNFLPVVPGDKIHINMFSEARFAPMVVPTYMSVKLYNRAFFVPMSSIWKTFEYYYTDRQDSSVLKTIPLHTNKFFVDYFVNSTKVLCTDITSTYEEGQKYDFYYGSSYYLFTEQGRLFYKLLLSLGYSVNFTSSDTTEFSWLPLFAFLRVAYDYLYPSQYVDSLALAKYFNITTQTELTDFYTDTNSVAFLDAIVDCLALPFNQDYFTAAWKTLNAPGTSSSTLVLSTPFTTRSEKAVSDSNSSYIQSSIYNNTSAFSQFGINLISRLYDFVTRNNLVGTRFADQIFAKFGIGSKQSDPDMSREIGRYVQPVQVQDVTQMAQTSEGALGEQGGKSIIFGNKGSLCDFDSSEFGYIIVVSTIIPDIGYYQGRKRWTVNHGSRLDNFYQPEFDMQMRAIRNDELFADYKNPTDYTNGSSYGGSPSGVFGFAPNYSEYKVGNDFLTGDFRLDSLRTNLDSYHLFRDIPTPSVLNPLALNSSFLFCKQHQFDKIFQQPYTLRYNINFVYYLGSYYLFVGGKLAILEFEGGSPSSKYVLEYYSGDNSECIGISLLTDDFLTALLSAFNNEYISLYLTEDSEGYNFDLFNQTIYFNGELTYAIPWYYPNSGTQKYYLENKSDFLALFSDYIDHVYLHHYFDIKATRPMSTISEEFMIEDGGKLINVDMLGNH